MHTVTKSRGVIDYFTSDLNNNSRFTADNYFRLDEDFLAKYEGKKPNFGYNGLGELVFYRTYSRLKPDGSKESPLETFARVVEGCFEIQRRYCSNMHISWTFSKAQKSAQEMFERMWLFKFLPPGRGLWAMGTDFMWKRGSAALNNCGYISTIDIDKDPVTPFTFMIDMSMLGVGVGFDTKGADKLEIVLPHGNKHIDIEPNYIIDDSREGWVDSVRQMILSYTTDPDIGHICYDYTKIRPAGAVINGFGGKASGPGILRELNESIRDMLDDIAARDYSYLTSVDIVDLMNLIGKCVVAGNVRRCLPKGTLVHLKRGLVPIEEVQIGDLVLTTDGYYSVAENVHQGVQRVVTIKTQMGQIRCTDRHRIAILTDIGEYEWKRARQLKSGDKMVFVDEIIPGTNTTLPLYFNPAKYGTRLNIPGLTDNVAWFLGYIHGDGYIYLGREYRGRKHHGASVMAPVNRDEYHDAITEKVNDGFLSFGNFNIKEQPSQDNCRRIRVISRRLAEYFYNNFKRARKPLGVPKCILQGKADIRAAYLAGLLDSDGSTKNRPTTLISSVYCDFLRQVQTIYSSLGIPTKMKLRKDEDENGQAKWEISLVGDFAINKFKMMIQPHAVKQLPEHVHASGYDFGYPSSWINRDKVDYGRSWTPQSSQMTHHRAVLCGAKVDNLVPVEVESVVDEGVECDTYDLSVPDRSEFVAQGLLVHNTAEIAFGDPDDYEYCQMKNPTAHLDDAESAAFNKGTSKVYDEGRNIATIADFNGAIPKTKLHKAIDTWNALNDRRWASNNSVFGTVGMNYDIIADQIAHNGEPGFLWLDNIRNFGRMVEGRNPDVDGRVMGANPCCEQSLESHELCCLVETFPANHEDVADYHRTLKFAYLYGKTVTLMPTHDDNTNAVLMRNKRIGLSQSGIVQAFKKFGRRVVLHEFCDDGYAVVKKWDDVYSSWLCCRTSIKMTSIKPSGTVSLLAGATAGIHYTIAPSRSYWRNVRIAADSILIDILRDAGYDVVPSVVDKGRTWIAKFGVNEPDIETVSEISIWEQVKNAVDYQRYWADNQVSCTIQFKPEEAGLISTVLDAFDDELKGISFLPSDNHGYIQAPYETATEAEVEAYNAGLKPLDFSKYLNEDAAATKFCDGETCQIELK